MTKVFAHLVWSVFPDASQEFSLHSAADMVTALRTMTHVIIQLPLFVRGVQTSWGHDQLRDSVVPVESMRPSFTTGQYCRETVLCC